jgi:hypothetical protein
MLFQDPNFCKERANETVEKLILKRALPERGLTERSVSCVEGGSRGRLLRQGVSGAFQTCGSCQYYGPEQPTSIVHPPWHSTHNCWRCVPNWLTSSNGSPSSRSVKQPHLKKQARVWKAVPMPKNLNKKWFGSWQFRTPSHFYCSYWSSLGVPLDTAVNRWAVFRKHSPLWSVNESCLFLSRTIWKALVNLAKSQTN